MAFPLWENRLRHFKSRFQQHNFIFSKPDIYSARRITNKDNEPQTRQWQRCFIQHLYHSSYFIIDQHIQEFCQLLNHRHHKSDRKYSHCQLTFRLRLASDYSKDTASVYNTIPHCQVIRKYGLKISTSTITYGTLGGATKKRYTVEDGSQPSCIHRWLDLLLESSLPTNRDTSLWHTIEPCRCVPEGLGQWTTRGCTLQSPGGDTALIHCDHLTSFAVMQVTFARPGTYSRLDAVTVQLNCRERKKFVTISGHLWLLFWAMLFLSSYTHVHIYFCDRCTGYVHNAVGNCYNNYIDHIHVAMKIKFWLKFKS